MYKQIKKIIIRRRLISCLSIINLILISSTAKYPLLMGILIIWLSDASIIDAISIIIKFIFYTVGYKYIVTLIFGTMFLIYQIKIYKKSKKIIRKNIEDGIRKIDSLNEILKENYIVFKNDGNINFSSLFITILNEINDIFGYQDLDNLTIITNNKNNKEEIENLFDVFFEFIGALKNILKKLYKELS